jgi:hypothetical protein
MLQSHIISTLARDLKNRYHSSGKRGLLYLAIKLVAEKKAIAINNQLLHRYNIFEYAYLDSDWDTLQDDLGLSRDIFFARSISYGYFKYDVDEHTWSKMIMAASAILLLILPEVLAELAEDNRESLIAGTELRKQIKSPVVMALAFVTKGKELADLQPHTALEQPEIFRLLDRATYFLCTPLQKLARIQQELNLDEGEIDRESEQQIVVVITFESLPTLKEDEAFPDNFPNKIALTGFLRRGSRKFILETMHTLRQASGLKDLGFVRT